MFRRRPNRFLVNKEMFAFFHSRELLDIAEDVIGTSDLSVHGIFNARPQLPEANWTETPFHQDSQYWGLNYGAPEPDTERRTHVMTIWMPLQPVDDRTGGLKLLSKNDTGDQLFDIHDYDYETTGFLGLTPEDIRRHPAYCPTMKPGDALIFNQRTPHGAAPNVADHVRWSIDVRYEATKTATTIGQRFGFVVQSKDPAKETTFEEWQRKVSGGP
jgi:ectoine hydroxylase-related dioxygenase (phytanoyl-CoA dioxygenase family)